MNFESQHIIWYFWLLPILFVMFLFVERRRQGILSALFPKSIWPKRLPDLTLLSYWLRFCLFAAALAMLILAWMKPYSDYEMREVTKKGVDLFFAVDLSQSMKSQDVKPSRIGRARREIMDFLSRLTGDRVGMIGFAGEAYVFVPMTSDYAAIDLFIDELDPGAIPIPGTNIEAAIRKAVSTFAKQSQASGKAVILITDGEDSLGLDEDLIAEIQKLNVKVFIIGIGTLEGAPIPLDGGGYKSDQDGKVVISKLNEDALKALALSTGGGYTRSVSGDLDLEQIYFEGIKKSLDESELKTKQRKIPVYEFQKFILIALVLLTFEILITNRKWYWLKKLRFTRKSKSTTPKKSFFGSRRSIWILFALLLVSSSELLAQTNPFDWDNADRAFQNGQYEEALAKYLELSAKDSQNEEILYNLGNTYYQLKKYDEAITAYQKALNSDDSTIRKHALYNLGNAQFRKQNLDEALKSYELALGMDKDFKPAQLNYDFVKKKKEEKEQQQKQQQEEEQKDEQQEKDQENQQNNQDQNQQDQSQNDQQKDQQDQQQQNQDNQDQQEQNQQDQKNDQNENKEQEKQDQDKDPNSENQDQDQNDQENDNEDKNDKPEDEDEKQDQQNQQDQQDPQEKQNQQDEQDQQDQQDQEEDSEAFDGDQKQDESSEGDSDQPQKPLQQFQFDANPNKLLDSISDEPGKVLRRMILQQTTPPDHKIEKDW